MNGLFVGFGVIVCLYHQKQLETKNMFLNFLPFRDHSLHKCHYIEDLVYWLRPLLILRFVSMLSKTFLDCNHLKIKADQDCCDMIILISSTQ